MFCLPYKRADYGQMEHRTVTPFQDGLYSDVLIKDGFYI